MIFKALWYMVNHLFTGAFVSHLKTPISVGVIHLNPPIILIYDMAHMALCVQLSLEKYLETLV